MCNRNAFYAVEMALIFPEHDEVERDARQNEISKRKFQSIKS